MGELIVESEGGSVAMEEGKNHENRKRFGGFEKK